MASQQTCRWSIKGPEGRALKIEFEDFDLEQPTRYSANVTRCRYDYIYVSGSKLYYTIFSKLNSMILGVRVA